jgi:hypothetical protein
MAMRGQSASNWQKKVKGKVWDRAERKTKEKRGKGKSTDTISIEQAMANVPNEEFFLETFVDDHVSRSAPDTDEAIAVAVTRGVATSTTIFLQGEDFQVLADDIRAFHSKQYRVRGTLPTFTSNKIYPYINVTTAPGAAPVAAEVQWGLLRFGMQLHGHAPLGMGAKAPVYAISHLEEMIPSTQTQDGENSEEEDDAPQTWDANSDDDI